MRKDDERAELVSARDAADRQLVLANELYVTASRALRAATEAANTTSVAVYHYDAALVVD